MLWVVVWCGFVRVCVYQCANISHCWCYRFAKASSMEISNMSNGIMNIKYHTPTVEACGLATKMNTAYS